MKILQVSNFLAPVHGGSAEVPYQLSKTLATRNHRVDIYSADSKQIENLNLRAGLHIETFNTWIKLATFDITPGISSKIKKDIKNFDIVHLHNFRTYQNIVAHGFAVKCGIPYVLQAHGSLTTFFQKRALKKLFDLAWGDKILKDASKVFAVTNIEAEQYISLGIAKEKIELVPHGVDLSEFDGVGGKGALKKKFNIDDGKKIVLYLGRIHRTKGLGTLVSAFAEICRRRTDTVLVITGPDDGYLAGVNKLVNSLKIHDWVLFTGPLYGREKVEAYLDADVYALPSSYEIFGITILEAWACRKPVVVTDKCGLADAVSKGGGLVVKNDETNLRDALLKLLDDAQLRAAYGREGRKMVEEVYNWPDIAARVERIYENVLSGKTTGRQNR